MLQMITAIMKDPKDPTICHLLFANQVSPLHAGLGSEDPSRVLTISVSVPPDGERHPAERRAGGNPGAEPRAVQAVVHPGQSA